MADEALFAIVDVETTGFSPITGSRVVEIAILRVDLEGVVTDEYVTLVNPLSPMEPGGFHGIVDSDVVDAPTFQEIAGDVLRRLNEVVLVGHNVRFDRDFLAAELSSSGVFLPSIPALCTLRLAYRLHPELLNHRIDTCCDAAGLEVVRAHDALSEAHTTAHLLRHYLREATGSGITLAEVLDGELVFHKPWPSIPESGRTVARLGRASASATDDSFLLRVSSARAGSGTTESTAAYLDLLDRALADRVMSDDEALALDQTAREWGLSPEEVRGAHQSYLRSLVQAALADSWITGRERSDLTQVAALLRLEPSSLDSLIADVAENVD